MGIKSNSNKYDLVYKKNININKMSLIISLIIS